MPSFPNPDTDLNHVLENLKQGKVSPLFLICGDDFLIKDTLHKMTELILPPEGRDLSLFYIDGETESQDAIREAVLTPPLIGGVKLVVVRNAEFLRASTPLPQAVSKFLNLIESDPVKAARQFIAFLKKVGWALDDMLNGHWKEIPDSEWKKVTGPEEFESREQWLPRMMDLCREYGVTDRQKEGADEIEEMLLQGIPDGNCLILTSNSVDRRKSIFKLFAESGVVLDLSAGKEDRSGSRMKGVAGDIFREILVRSGKKLSEGAFELLGRKTGFDPQKMAGELEKLAAFAGDNSSIKEKDIEALISDKPEDSIFALTNSISERSSSKALLILRDLIDHGLHPLMIFTMIAREIRLLLYAKVLLQSEILKGFHPGMEYPQFQRAVYPVIKDRARSGKVKGELAASHPYALFQSLKSSTRFTRDECVGFLERLLETDMALKTTGQDPVLLLKRLLIVLCGAHTETDDPDRIRHPS